MATLVQIRNKANTVLAQFWSALQTKQDAYFAKHGKYFQLLVTNDVADGVDTTFELRLPDHEPHKADIDFQFNSPIPFKISVSEWVGPQGNGYRAIAVVELLNGRKFTRHRDSEQNDTDWFEVLPDQLT